MFDFYYYHWIIAIIWKVNKYRINIILLLSIIKCYILYWIISINLLISILFITLYSNLNLYITLLMNNKFYPLSWFMVIVVIIIASIYFIILDELIIGSAQRRIGPLNLGWYGILLIFRWFTRIYRFCIR